MGGKRKIAKQILILRGKILCLVLLIGLIGCKDGPKVEDEIVGIDLDLQVERFEQAFSNAEVEDIPALKERFPFLFPSQYPDSIWTLKLKDTLQRELFEEVNTAFPDFKQETAELELFFKHAEFHFPKFETPKVITVTNEVDYQSRIILTDSILFIGLDNYLGKEHRFYGSIERYVASGLDKKYLVSDVASAFAKRVVRYPSDRSFLARMIYYGKELYVKDQLLPLATDAVKIGYTEEEMAWAEANESQIWRYFVERELLYSTDLKLGPRFLDPAPFSKFRLELDNESPGRLGRFMGWQIVKAFAKQNSLKLEQLLLIPEDEIFKKSNYKPKK